MAFTEGQIVKSGEDYMKIVSPSSEGNAAMGVPGTVADNVFTSNKNADGTEVEAVQVPADALLAGGITGGKRRRRGSKKGSKKGGSGSGSGSGSVSKSLFGGKKSKKRGGAPMVKGGRKSRKGGAVGSKH